MRDANVIWIDKVHHPDWRWVSFTVHPLILLANLSFDLLCLAAVEREKYPLDAGNLAIDHDDLFRWVVFAVHV